MSQSFLLLCKCSAIESSYSSAPLLNISTSIYIANIKLTPGSIARSTCSSPWVLPPPSQTNHCGSHRLLGCTESGTSTSQMCSHHSWAPAQTSNINLRFPPCYKSYNCFLPPVPWGRLWSQGHWPVLLPVLVPKICHWLTVFHLFYNYQHSSHAFLFLQGLALPHSQRTGDLLLHATDLLCL